MANYLFTLTISPVQSFIAQARKSQDLFAGSEILSELMGKVLETFTVEERIFPQTKEAVSNKIVVKLIDKDPIEIGEKLEKLVTDELYTIGTQSILSVKDISIDRQFFQEHIKTQLCEFFQVFWVAVKLEDDYSKSYKQLEQNLGAVKNLRTFRQEPQESGLKCSLCGERNGLFYKYQEDENKKPKKPSHIIKNALYLKKSNQIDGNETLCAVCFTKRFYSNNNYPSTAKIALLDWIKKVPNQNEYENLFKKPFDESLYFKENLSKEYLTKWEYFKSDDDLENAINFLDNLKIDVKQKKYYALIHFDVDSLGKTLSGLDEEGQIKLSKKLGEFAQKVGSEVLTSQKGRTVYAGGDDFLGFVNLKYLFTVFKCIKRAFKQIVLKEFPNLTFSTSIVIAHYKTPLHKVLDYSRELLEESKKHFDDKNGLGIMVMSSNAVISKTICRYGDVALLQKMKKAEMAKNLHFKLAQIFDYLGEMRYDEFLTQKAMIEVEIKRLIERESGKLEKNKELKELYEEIIAFLYKQNIELSTKLYQFDFDNFIGYLKTLEQLRKVCYDKIHDDKTA